MSYSQVNRREFLQSTGSAAMGALLASALGQPAAGQAAAQRPNILYIMADDHARHALSCYGSAINQTPNLDRIAREGVRFSHCCVTNSLCGPSRATLLTGCYSHINGFKDNGPNTKFDSSQSTFIKLLHESGYQTAVIGKWHLVSDPVGFDHWEILPGQGVYNNPPFIANGKRTPTKGYVTDLITDKSIAWLKQRDPKKPFCLLCHHKAPHRGWVPDEKHKAMYADKDIPDPATFNDDYKNRASAAAHADMRVAEMPDYQKEHKEGMTPEQIKEYNYQRFIKDYLRCIASVDDNVGRLLDYLDDSGLAKNTIVIYTSDNGFFLGDHGWFDKRFMYEDSLHVPFLVRFAGKIAAGTREEFAINADFAPTFLDYAGVAIPERMQGRSLRPVLEGKTPADWRQSVYYRYYEYPQPHRARPHYGVRTAEHKLVYYNTVDEWELFDLKKDPQELRSVYAEAGYAGVVERLKAELVRLRRELRDTEA